MTVAIPTADYKLQVGGWIHALFSGQDICYSHPCPKGAIGVCLASPPGSGDHPFLAAASQLMEVIIQHMIIRQSSPAFEAAGSSKGLNRR